MAVANKQLEEQIKKKLEELSKASGNEKQFLGSELKEGEEIKPKDFFKMAEAFDTTSLKNIELDILLAKRHKFQGWREAVVELESQAKELRDKIAHWKRREFPSNKVVGEQM